MALTVQGADLNIALAVDPLFQNDYQVGMGNSGDTIADRGCTLTAWAMFLNYEIKRLNLYERKSDETDPSFISYTPAELNSLLNNHTYSERDGKQYNGWSVALDTHGQPEGPATGNLNIGALFKAVREDTKNRSASGLGLNQERFIASGFAARPQLDPSGVVLDAGFPDALAALKQGIPVVARVAGNTHTVLITSYHGPEDGSGRYDILDPWKDPNDGKTIRWLDDPDYGNRIFEFSYGVVGTGGFRTPFEVPSDGFLSPLEIPDPAANPGLFGPQVVQANSERVVNVPDSGPGWFGAATVVLLLWKKRKC